MPTAHRHLLLALVAAAGCSKQAEAPHGAPILLEVLCEVEGFTQRVWSRDPDGGAQPMVSAGTSKINFIFDRRLDGSRIEDTVDGNQVPKANPPITISWPDMATTMSDPPFAADVFYNSLSTFGAGTTHAFVRPQIAGFPSATTITFTLDPNGLTSIYGEPMDGPTTITVNTSPLAVTLPSSTATVPLSYRAAVVFSTRAPKTPAMMPFVQVGVGTSALPFQLVADPGDARKVYVIPACADGWPTGARVEVVADVGLPDGFGRPLMTAAKGSFMTSSIAPGPVDGACGPLDAGTFDAPSWSDAGAPDAPLEAGVPDGGADAPGDAQSN